MPLNMELLKLASWQLNRSKQAFVPVGASASPPPGGPPPDPAANAPPPGSAPPPMDPSAGGGAPPSPGGPAPDPSAGGAPPGGATPDLNTVVQQAAQAGAAQALAQAGGGAGGEQGKPPKPDIATIATDIFQLKKMFHHFMRLQQIEMPPELLDGPNRHPQTGMPAPGATGGSDPSPGAAPAQPPSSISGIQPIQGAFPGGKTASIGVGTGAAGPAFMSKAASVAALCRKRKVAC